MGRFSPREPGPSWTQGLAQGAQNLTQELMQRRQLRLQQQKQDFDENIATQNEARENAAAGYTPAQPFGASTANTPEGLDRISNAGVSDAGTPARYDPTASGPYAVWNLRGDQSIARAGITADARVQAAETKGRYGLEDIAARYGTIDANGNFVPGVQTQSAESVQQPKLDMTAAWRDNLTSQFGRNLSERTRHDKAMENRPVGGNRMSIGGPSAPSPSEVTNINAQTARYQQPQKVPGRLGADGASMLTKTVPGMSADSASARAVGNVNMTREAVGRDSLSNPASMRLQSRGEPQPTVAPTVPDSASTAAHVTRSGLHASTAPAPAPGAQTATHPGSTRSVQELPSTGQPLPSSPTADNAPAARPPLDGRSKLMAKTNPAYKASLQARGYKEGVDF